MTAGSNGAAAAARIDQGRLWRHHKLMAEFGAFGFGGVNRQAFTKEDAEARRLLVSWATAQGFPVQVDGIGNLFIRREGRDPALPPVMTGSHMDSQPEGGRFDGIYGVLAGFEALLALEESGCETERPVEVVAWSNEEGGRFAPGAMGSMVFTGARSMEEVLELRDSSGTRLAEALAETLAATPEAGQRAFGGPVSAYLEAHIEQGPVLEQEGLSIGVVTGIQGTRWFDVEVSGESAHAGTTPPSARRDALQEALGMVQALNGLAVSDALAGEPESLRFTVGRFDVTPNTPNSIPGRVSFSVDLRHPEASVIRALGDAVAPLCQDQARRCEVKVRETLSRPPCLFDEKVVASVEQAARALGEPHRRMASGAFHDALFMSDLCPTGMIFVPCERGISHNPAESARPEDLAAGARVLVSALVELAGK